MKNDDNVTFLFLLFQFEQKTGAVFDEIVENCKYHSKKKKNPNSGVLDSKYKSREGIYL